jgi:hypothetical protein
MRFKQFLQLELDGLFGNTNSNLGLIKSQIKDCQPIKGKGTTVKRMSSVTKPSMPARPSGLISLKKPMTIKSVI